MTSLHIKTLHQNMRWKRVGKRTLVFFLISVSIWWLYLGRTFTLRQEHAVNVFHSPKVIWDFVADLNHMKITNPGLKYFEIISDEGIHPNWHYSAVLTEDRKQFGTIKVHSNYNVKPYGNDYVIISSYNLCKYALCVHVNSTMLFKKNENSEKYETRIIEDLSISLTNFLSWIVDCYDIAEYHKVKLNNIVSHMKNRIPA